MREPIIISFFSALAYFGYTSAIQSDSSYYVLLNLIYIFFCCFFGMLSAIATGVAYMEGWNFKNIIKKSSVVSAYEVPFTLRIIWALSIVIHGYISVILMQSNFLFSGCLIAAITIFLAYVRWFSIKMIKAQKSLLNP